MVSQAACIHCGACKKVCPTPDHCTACGKCVPACRHGFRKICGQEWTAEALSERLLKDRDVYAAMGGGVTFSGGEPLMQWDFVSTVIDRLNGVHTAIETSGCASDEAFTEAMKRCSLILMDWKVTDPGKSQQYVGGSQETILRHFDMLAKGDTPFILRLPIIPTANDNPAHFEKAAALVKNAKALVRAEILLYQRAAGAKYEMIGRKYEPEFDESIAPEFFLDVLEKYGIPYRLFR